MLRAALIALSFAACVPPSYTPTPSYFYAVVPLSTYPPAPFYHYPLPAPFVPLTAYRPPPFYYQPPSPSYYPPPPPVIADVQLETPSLVVRALAGKISAAASQGDCAGAIAAGDELEKVNRDSHHAMLAIDQRYAACIRGF